MTNTRTNVRWVCTVALIASLAAFSPHLSAKDKLPEVSHDGLHLQKDTKLAAVYLKPGATLDQYDKVAILDCFVSFKKNWQRDYNEDVIGLGRRVSDKDADAIKKRVAKEFTDVFTKELETKGGYPVVDNAAQDVLVLRPAIINLVVTDPDTMSPGMSRTFVSSAGQMTLYLELYDSVTSDIIARIIDPEAARSDGIAQIGGRVANKAEADQILRRWADVLRSHLGELQKATSDNKAASKGS
jgi:hypothetical protein